MKTKRQTQEYFFNAYTQNREIENKEIFFDSKIYKITEKNKIYLLIFQGRKIRPVIFYSFNTKEEREIFIGKYKARIENKNSAKIKHLEEKKIECEAIQKDTILISCWGFEQTNVSFYQVLERKGSTIVVQEIGQNKEYNQQDAGYCTPIKNDFKGDAFQKKLTKEASIKLNSFEIATIYNGKKIYFSSYN